MHGPALNSAPTPEDVTKPALASRLAVWCIELEAAANTVLDGVSGVPQVVVVGPVNAHSLAGARPFACALLHPATESYGRQCGSALEWELEFLPDDLHLTPNGPAGSAELVAEATS